MARTHLRIAVAMLALLVFAASSQAGQKYAGRIQSVTESQLVLKVGTELMTFQIDKMAMITLNGKVVKATELKEDDETTLQAEKGDDATLKAMSISATRKTVSSRSAAGSDR